MLNLFKRKKEEPENLKEVLKRCGDLEEKIGRISNELEKLKKRNEFSVQKISIIRYNPFSKVGSDQSFSAALLDGNNNGNHFSLYQRRE